MPNYGPGPDFSGGTIYRQDDNEHAYKTSPDHDDEGIGRRVGGGGTLGRDRPVTGTVEVGGRGG
jgi:hypothetical protein